MSTSRPAAAPPTYKMYFDPNTIDHLGLRLYSTLPPVLSELVSNAYDAESPKVEVTLPVGPVEGRSEVVVRDYGHGMDALEIQSEYLPIGRNRRGDDTSRVRSKHDKVVVTGRKGIGKLSAFGVAEEMEIRSVKDRQAICILLRYDEIRNWTSEHKEPAYEPHIVPDRCGPTSDPNGVEVRLRGLKRRRSLNQDQIRRGIARRLAIIGPKFRLSVNGQEVQPGDRRDRDDCPDGYSWEVTEVPGGDSVGEIGQVRGWIGFVAASSQASADRGVDIFANGKAVELGSFFNYPSTHAQFARAHLIGELHADFLDAAEDLASTARDSVVWESEAGAGLERWGQDALKWIFDRWIELRRREKEETITKIAGFDEWLKQRSEREQSVAKRMVKLLVDDEALEPESARRLLEIVKGSVEARAFEQLIVDLESQGAGVGTILKLFEEWRVIEAREHLKLADGRLSALEKLGEYMRTNALEVKQIQPLFERNLWLVDPAWVEAEGQTTYTEMIRKYCVESKDTPTEDRRLDILGVRHSSELTILELKRPGKTLSRKELEQIEAYVDWARAKLVGTGPDAPRYVKGVLVVGHLSGDGGIAKKMERLAGDDVRVTTFADLRDGAREYYGQVEKALRHVAPEYAERVRRKHAKLAK